MGLGPPDRFEVTLRAESLPETEEGQIVRVAGRVMLWRRFGGLVFGQIRDQSGQLQVSLSREELDKESFQRWSSSIKLGDYIGGEGLRWTSKTGEPTVGLRSLEILTAAVRPFPVKSQGLEDVDERRRRRYLDLLVNPESAERFRIRAEVLREFRNALADADFQEADTPILQDAAAGASARPFITRHDALQRDFVLRISPETYLKRLVVGGMDRVYEMSRNFRNEGIDASHLQEFTLLEWYAAYWNYRDNMEFTRSLINRVIERVHGTLSIEGTGTTYDFGREWPVIDYRDAVEEATEIDLRSIQELDELRAKIGELNLPIKLDQAFSYASLVDRLYKRTVRPNLVQPCFLVHHPVQMVPLARRTREDPTQLDMYQVVVNGWELVKGYSELVDPVEQRERLEEQLRQREAGDEEAMMLEEDFIEAMEYGMPPMSGAGLGIDRFTALISGTSNLRDVVLFPTLRERAK